MNDPSPPPPEWIYKRDGRLEPFDADRLCRSLFAATERLGQPDAFTARELTDGVLHFLAAETEGRIATTAHVAETVVKVVRELGHPALAQAFARGAQDKVKLAAIPASRSAPLPMDSPQPGAAAMMRDFALSEVFPRELVSAHENGLLTLTGLESPLELSGWLLGPVQPGRLFEALDSARRITGGFIAVDGPEYALADDVEASVRDFVREFHLGLRATGLAASVNLNCQTPPPWAGDLADGPLFAGRRLAVAAERRGPLAVELRDRLLAGHDQELAVRIDWHLSESDVNAVDGAPALMALIGRALDGAPLAFAFDRPRRPVPLAEGIDRQHPAVLLSVGIHLPQLVRELERRQGRLPDQGQFLEKLRSLVRLALSAGVQKRNFLRRTERPWPGFLLDRARLVVAPVGLEAVAQRLAGGRICDGAAALDFAKRIVARLAEFLAADGRACHLEACLDTSAAFTEAPFSFPGQAFTLESVCGVTPWDVRASGKQQLKASGTLHASLTGGTAAILVPDDSAPSLDELAALLRTAWRQTDIARLRFLRGSTLRVDEAD